MPVEITVDDEATRRVCMHAVAVCMAPHAEGLDDLVHCPWDAHTTDERTREIVCEIDERLAAFAAIRSDLDRLLCADLGEAVALETVDAHEFAHGLQDGRRAIEDVLGDELGDVYHDIGSEQQWQLISEDCAAERLLGQLGPAEAVA